MNAQEFNFDGLVGPTHNYAGLSHGNIASIRHQHAVSSPKSAALQGLAKMKFVRDLGVPQCILPPLPRPNLNFLRSIGFSGTDEQIISNAHKVDPVLIAICFSASNMWTANAATVSPKPDSSDSRLHLTPANLSSNLHRSLEGPVTTKILRQIFSDENEFSVHDPLIGSTALSDEGAANHTRFCNSFGDPGLQLFVYGVEFLNRDSARPTKFPARQTFESCQSIARRHKLDKERFLLIQQNPVAIDAGVFHNDVISVGHQNVLLTHEQAFLNQAASVDMIRKRFESIYHQDFHVVTITPDELPIADAVTSYLFNSQIVTLPSGELCLICPSDCEENAAAKACTQKIVESENPITCVHFLDLRQSMNNGGGPACLRLRVVLDEQQQSKIHQPVVLTDQLYEKLVKWVNRHYRDALSPTDLLDPQLLRETRSAFESLSEILALQLIDD